MNTRLRTVLFFFIVFFTLSFVCAACGPPEQQMEEEQKDSVVREFEKLNNLITRINEDFGVIKSFVEMEDKDSKAKEKLNQVLKRLTDQNHKLFLTIVEKGLTFKKPDHIMEYLSGLGWRHCSEFRILNIEIKDFSFEIRYDEEKYEIDAIASVKFKFRFAEKGSNSEVYGETNYLHRTICPWL